MGYWSVAMTKSQSEHIAKWNLDKQGFENYLPKYIEGKGKFTKVKVLFPRYIFVKIELQWSPINNTRGISRLIMNELTPAKVSDTVIMSIKAQEDKKGYVALPEMPKFSPGDEVKIESGSFSGYIGIFAGMKSHDRVRVLIQMLGREVPIELDESCLAVVISEKQNISSDNKESIEL